MGKVDRLHRVEPFAALLWALGIVLANTWPCSPARLHSTAVHKSCPSMVIVVSILHEDGFPFLFPYLGILFIFGNGNETEYTYIHLWFLRSSQKPDICRDSLGFYAEIQIIFGTVYSVLVQSAILIQCNLTNLTKFKTLLETATQTSFFLHPFFKKTNLVNP